MMKTAIASPWRLPAAQADLDIVLHEQKRTGKQADDGEDDNIYIGASPLASLSADSAADFIQIKGASLRDGLHILSWNAKYQMP